MITRREFLTSSLSLACVAALAKAGESPSSPVVSDFARRLRPVGRILELEGYYVWCQAPIEDENGRTHVFFSRWSAKKGMGGWINSSEIAHAVADRPEGPYSVRGTVLAPRGSGFWDGTTCHNPHIKKVGNRYALFYMGNSNGKTDTKRIGLALADSLDGPWTRMDAPLLEPGATGAWDDHCTTNPSLVQHPNGQFWLYYKSWNTEEYRLGKPPVRGNRKYGLAISDQLEGPYRKHPQNPLLDFSDRGNNAQCEDAFIWHEDGLFKAVMRDMGVFNHQYGLYLTSHDGLSWSEPQMAYDQVRAYVDLPPAPKHLSKYGRFERPQLLLRNGRPAYLFTTTQGGAYESSTGFVFKIE